MEMESGCVKRKGNNDDSCCEGIVKKSHINSTEIIKIP